MKPRGLSEAVHGGNEYIQIKPSTNPGATIWQVEEEEANLEQVQVA